MEQRVAQLLDRIESLATVRGNDRRADGATVRALVSDLTRRGASGVAAWMAELERAVPSPLALGDILAQGWFARVLLHNGFTTTMNPLGTAGPDLRVDRDGAICYVEVRRFRRNDAEHDALMAAPDDEEPDLICVGDFEKDTLQVVTEIKRKGRQGRLLPASAAYVVAIASDRDAIGRFQFAHAVRDLEEEARRGGATCASIGAVLFDPRWVDVKTGDRWVLWTNPSAAPGRRLAPPHEHTLRALLPPPPLLVRY